MPSRRRASTLWVNVRLNEHTAGYLNSKPDLLRREIAAIVELARRTMIGEPESRWYDFEWIDHGYEEMMGVVDITSTTSATSQGPASSTRTRSASIRGTSRS